MESGLYRIVILMSGRDGVSGIFRTSVPWIKYFKGRRLQEWEGCVTLSLKDREVNQLFLYE